MKCKACGYDDENEEDRKSVDYEKDFIELDNDFYYITNDGYHGDEHNSVTLCICPRCKTVRANG